MFERQIGNAPNFVLLLYIFFHEIIESDESNARKCKISWN